MPRKDDEYEGELQAHLPCLGRAPSGYGAKPLLRGPASTVDNSRSSNRKHEICIFCLFLYENLKERVYLVLVCGPWVDSVEEYQSVGSGPPRVVDRQGKGGKEQP